MRRRADGSAPLAGRDELAVEEPLEVRVDGKSLLVTMRTPGRDLDLVRGLLWTDGLVDDPGDIAAIAHCDDVPVEARGHVVQVALRQGAVLRADGALRVGLVSSACGVCGKSVLDLLDLTLAPIEGGPRLTEGLLAALPARMAEGQSVFARTGGLHAAALFAADGRRLALAEDVGRHNAVDKVLGEALRFGRASLPDAILLVSGRAGFEIVQKARRAGIPVVGSVSAPSSLAVEVARRGGQTLVGFLREGRFNVYCGGERVLGGE